MTLWIYKHAVYPVSGEPKITRWMLLHFGLPHEEDKWASFRGRSVTQKSCEAANEGGNKTERKVEREEDVVSVTKSWTSWTLFLRCEGRRTEVGVHVGSSQIQFARHFAVLDPFVHL